MLCCNGCGHPTDGVSLSPGSRSARCPDCLTKPEPLAIAKTNGQTGRVRRIRQTVGRRSRAKKT